MRYLPALSMVYVDSASGTSFSASVDTYYVVDTAAGAVTVTIPSGVDIGHWLVIQNAPANGPQVGGGATGNTITIKASGSELIDGSSSITLGPPTSTVTAKGDVFFPAGPVPATGFGAGWVHI